MISLSKYIKTIDIINMPLFKRHKILLGVILNSKDKPSKTELMKWIFLTKKETILKNENSYYDFVPYDYGPFSFTLYRDLNDLSRMGYLSKDQCEINDRLRDSVAAVYREIPKTVRDSINQVVQYYSQFDQDSLISSVYEKYPWFAHRSKLKSNAEPEVESNNDVLYTIGYEGKSIDTFLQHLIRAKIKNLIDVRNNPVSRKYGFSKKSLSGLCSKLNIEYIHMPDLGVPSKLRQRLETFEDYQNLLNRYEKEIIPKLKEERKQAEEYTLDKPSALVCFEADVRCCHRSRLAKALAAKTGQTVRHL